MSGLEAALEVANRACSPFLRWRPEAHFFRAELLERLGRKDEARGVYQRVLSEVRRFIVRGVGCVKGASSRNFLVCRRFSCAMLLDMAETLGFCVSCFSIVGFCSCLGVTLSCVF